MRLLRLALPAAVAAVAACSGSSTDPPDQGSFQATVSGDLSLSLTGTAQFGTEGQDFEGFGIALVSGQVGQNNSDFVMIARDNTTRPAAGEYEIVDVNCTDCTADDFSGIYLHQVTLFDLGLYVSVSGTLTIETSTAEQMTGSFSLTVTEFILSGDVTAEDLSLQGSFRAVPGTIPSPQ
jgi:hypothetical protein